MRKRYEVPETELNVIQIERNFCESDLLDLKTETQSGYFWDEE